MPSFFSTVVFAMCNLFGFCVGKSIGMDDTDDAAAVSVRGVKTQRIEFPFEVAVDVGAQCKFKESPFLMKMT